MKGKVLRYRGGGACHQVTVCLNDEEAEVLERLVRATGQTKTGTMRLAIRELYNAMSEAIKETA
jgi:hypothetical protein